MAPDVIIVRRLHAIEEIAPIEALQTEIWGYDGRHDHVYPARGLFALAESGGLVGGAYDGAGRLVGFSVAWIGRDDGTLYLHSQLVGVLDGYRDAGIGLRLKLQQREFALAGGLATVRWTFDPLRPRNAHFNLHKLGAVARRFAPNYYGALGGTLNTGRATDRLWAEWHVASPRVARRLEGAPPPAPAGAPFACRLARRGDAWRLPDVDLALDAPVLLVELPLDPDTAAGPGADAAGYVAGLQERLRRVFGAYLPAYTIVDCHRAADRIAYVLDRAAFV
jgi:predicted GNAT superfamily acetyltransferase